MMFLQLGVVKFNIEKELTKEEKMKLLRSLRGTSQPELAGGMERSIATFIRSETGKRKFKAEELKKGLKYLGLEGLPLDDEEALEFKHKLYDFRDKIRNEHHDEVQNLRIHLSCITFAKSFEPDLYMLFLIFEAFYLLRLGKIEEVRKTLVPYVRSVKKNSNEVQYHFYHLLGVLHRMRMNFKKSRRYFLLAEEKKTDDFESDPLLGLNLAVFYGESGKYTVAVAKLERMYHLFNHDTPNVQTMLLYNELGMNYVRLGHTEQAKELFHKISGIAKVLKNEDFSRYCLGNLGVAHFIAKEYEDAIYYLNQAVEQSNEISYNYFECLYYKTLCLMHMENPDYRTELKNGLANAKGNEYFSIMFNALYHLTTIDKQTSMDYIEHTAIPKMLELYQYSKTFDFFTALSNAYAKRSKAGGSKKDYIKSLEIGMKAFEIYVLLTSGKEDLK